MSSSETLLNEALAYSQQGLIYLDEGNQDGAKAMLSMAEKILSMIDDTSKENERYDTTLNVVNALKEKIGSDVSLKHNVSCDFTETLDAELLFWLPDGVQLVTIKGEETAAAPSPPTSLAIFRVESPQKQSKMYPDLNDSVPQAIIQIGPWAYPLIPDQSIIMKNELGVYVVPNPTDELPDMCVGIILPRDLKESLERDLVKVLQVYATVRESDVVSQMTQEKRERTSEKIAAFLQQSGEKFALKVQKVSISAGTLINDQGEKMRAGMTPTERPVNMNPVIKYGVLVGYKGSKAFAKLTRAILDKVGEVGVNIGRKVASGMKGHNEKGAGRVLSGSANIIGGGIAGVSVAWIALEEASKQLFKNFSDETVQVVKVKYGDQASTTSHQALHAVGHTTLSAFQLWDLGPRSVAGRMVRHAGIQVVRDLGSETDANKNSAILKIGTSKKN
ncbi:unnamed protein product [Bursaphelenchus xylophilus]|uniref:(pine wood nematode) hypothetical protein n=1 Tax=Bursaphelenchus xylophilus TaxID=6326 RepID=A0A1I7RY72_BURXY|nr:unnamed protein product [Bursaphelenchus xylophilus]CAG9085376.1 unnamed protein product [Bursaphelenchus xylophilus]